MTRKEEIKQVAAHMFRKRGYSATSMRDIAKELGMEAPSLYNHISGKQQLLSELLMMVAKLFTQGMKAICAEEESNLTKLQEIIRLHVDIAVDHTDAVSLLTNEWVHLEGSNSLDFGRMKLQYEKDFRETLEGCIADGEMEAVHVDLALFSILSTLRWLYSWYSRHPNIGRKELKEEMIRLLIPR